jgi:hypothetical protein
MTSATPRPSRAWLARGRLARHRNTSRSGCRRTRAGRQVDRLARAILASRRIAGQRRWGPLNEVAGCSRTRLALVRHVVHQHVRRVEATAEPTTPQRVQTWQRYDLSRRRVASDRRTDGPLARAVCVGHTRDPPTALPCRRECAAWIGRTEIDLRRLPADSVGALTGAGRRGQADRYRLRLSGARTTARDEFRRHCGGTAGELDQLRRRQGERAACVGLIGRELPQRRCGAGRCPGQ